MNETRLDPWDIVGNAIDPAHGELERHPIEALAEHGYVIVHPDDVPARYTPATGASEHTRGWNDCHRSIFGDAT